ncbi:FAD-dependent monooxygenase [Amycolatopsis lurida]
MTPRTVVVGGSIAGCAAAIAASRAGHRVTVYERRAGTLADRGFGIAIPPGLRAELITAGYLDADMPVGSARERIWVRGPDATVLWRQPSRVATCNWGLLWSSLRSRIPDVAYRSGQPVAAVRASAGQGLVTVSDTDVVSDLVIGADGYRSQVRRALAPATRPSYAGYCLWRSSIPVSELADTSYIRKVLAAAYVTVVFPGGHGILYLIPGGDGGLRLNWAIYAAAPNQEIDTGISPPSGHTPAPLVDHVRNIVTDFFPGPWRDAVLTTSPARIATQPVHDLTMTRVATPPFLLAGDAATITRPHTASGAVKALQDALALADALRKAPSLHAAVREYDRVRTEAGNFLVGLGRDLGRAQVENTPDWSTMGPSEMDSWTRMTLKTRTHYLYGNVTAELSRRETRNAVDHASGHRLPR